MWPIAISPSDAEIMGASRLIGLISKPAFDNATRPNSRYSVTVQRQTEPGSPRGLLKSARTVTPGVGDEFSGAAGLPFFAFRGFLFYSRFVFLDL